MLAQRLLGHLRHHVVGYLALFLVLGGVGHAAFVATDGTIKACVVPTTGASTANTRIIDEAADCQAGQTPIAWNQTGPPGPAGQTGPAGQVGPAGATGPTPQNLGSLQLGKPSGGLATKPGRSRREITKVRVPSATKKSKATISRRVFVTAVSGPLQIPTYSVNNSPPVPDPTRRAKTARVACPPSAPRLISAAGQGTAGAYDSRWSTTSGGYEDDGVSKAYVTVTAFLGPGDQKLPDGSSIPEFPGDLGAYVFEINGECRS